MRTQSTLMVRAGVRGELVDAFVSGGFAVVAWSALGNLSGVAPADIECLLAAAYPGSITRDGRPNLHHREIIEFATRTKPGNLVITSDRTRRLFLVGEVVGAYEYLDDPRLHSGGQPYQHALPVAWQFAVPRACLESKVLRDTDQRGKTTFWLHSDTVSAILTAPRKALEA